MSDWRPSASRELLQARAQLLQDIREFFSQRGVLEVETPLLARAPVTDPSLTPFKSTDRYLQTSPEYAMKRLLAADSGPIYQICKAFRQEEAGQRHNPEFTLLEWYRPGFDTCQLMEEVEQLLLHVLHTETVERYSYRQLFLEFADIDLGGMDDNDLLDATLDRFDLSFRPATRDECLDLLLTHQIEPLLAEKGVVFVYDYPASQAALSRLKQVDGAVVADRFETYVNGMELANGYGELLDAQEQRQRFEQDNQRLDSMGEIPRPVDEQLLSAMSHGLPDCSGVALGLDRLLMLRSGETDIRSVLAFDWLRA